jgi:hypothetical protein
MREPDADRDVLQEPSELDRRGWSWPSGATARSAR